MEIRALSFDADQTLWDYRQVQQLALRSTIALMELEGIVEPGSVSPPELQRQLRSDVTEVARGIIASEWIGDRDQTALVAADDVGRLAGFVTCRPASLSRVLEVSTTFVIGDTYVAPDARRTGIGSSLVEAAVGWAIRRGAESVERGTLAEEASAVAFWAAQGFGSWRLTLRSDLDGR